MWRHLFAVVLLAAVRAATADCPVPPILNDFSMARLEAGTWFEVGKFQSGLGAFFEKDCVCTHLTVSPNADGTATATNVCNYKTPTGQLTVANETIVANATAPGRFVATFPYPFAPQVSYNLMVLTDEFAIEYDCFDAGILGGLNYCFHVLSRHPTLDPSITQKLVALAAQYELNPLGLNFTMTMQQGCTYS